MPSMPSDVFFMRKAIELARRGVGATHPNPAVGCLIVRDQNIIGSGWHQCAGNPHAEIEALRSLPDPSLARGATAYVTLEPCSTHGRTPPCTDALIAAGISRVVVGAIDPNPRHRGEGLEILRKANIDVDAEVLASECAALNPEFHFAMSSGLPWVIIKCGLSLDGRITRPLGESRYITSDAARADAMKLRSRVDAILVGAGTVRADDPSLTIRNIPGSHRQPLRVVWSPKSLPPQNSLLFQDQWKSQTVVLRHASIEDALRDLAQRGILTILVEGGGHTLGCIMDAQLASEAVFYIAPILAGGAVPAIGGDGPSLSRPATELLQPHCHHLDDCLRISGLIKKSANK